VRSTGSCLVLELVTLYEAVTAWTDCFLLWIEGRAEDAVARSVPELRTEKSERCGYPRDVLPEIRNSSKLE